MEIGFYTNNYVNTYNNKSVKNKKSFDGLDILGPEAPNEVKEAWNKAEKECGINGVIQHPRCSRSFLYQSN